MRECDVLAGVLLLAQARAPLCVVEHVGVGVQHVAHHQPRPQLRARAPDLRRDLASLRGRARVEDARNQVGDVLDAVVGADDGDLVREDGEEEADDEAVVGHGAVAAEDDHVPVALVGDQLPERRLHLGRVLGTLE